jgi:hypothetical protein
MSDLRCASSRVRPSMNFATVSAGNWPLFFFAQLREICGLLPNRLAQRAVALAFGAVARRTVDVVLLLAIGDFGGLLAGRHARGDCCRGYERSGREFRGSQHTLPCATADRRGRHPGANEARISASWQSPRAPCRAATLPKARAGCPVQVPRAGTLRTRRAWSSGARAPADGTPRTRRQHGAPTRSARRPLRNVPTGTSKELDEWRC